MTIITDQSDIVVSISLIPGVSDKLKYFRVYFPWVGNIPREGDRLSESQKKVQHQKYEVLEQIED